MVHALSKCLMRRGVEIALGGCILALSVLWVWPPRGLIGQYYDNPNWQGEPVFTSRDTMLGLDAVTQRQATFPQRYFSVVWRGWVMIDRDGEYRFSTESDDGSSVILDAATQVVDNGGAHVARVASGSIFLKKGLHALQLNYFQGGGSYKLSAAWQEPGKVETAIPPFKLYPQPFPLPGIGLIMRNLFWLYPFTWGVLVATILVRQLMRARKNLKPLLKHYAFNIGLLATTVVVFGALAEGVMRAAMLLQAPPKDVHTLLQESKETVFAGGPLTYSLKGIVQESPYPDIVYELKPHLKGNFQGVPLVTNSQGLREFEYSFHKPEKTIRIVGLGDSSLFGWGVRLEDTSLKVLETMLNAQTGDIRYEVLNFAAPGYNTALEVEVFLKKCLKYEPDLVIMHFNTNDYDVPGFMKPAQSFATLKKSYFLNFLLARWQVLSGQQTQEMLPFIFDRTLGLEESELLDEDPHFPTEYRHLVGKRGFLRAIDTLLEATKARGIPVLVYVIKAYPGLDPNYTPNPFRDRQLAMITQLSQEKGFFLLNMYAPYRNYLEAHPEADEKVFWVSPEDSHPSAIAHRLEAEALYEFLSERSLLQNSDR